MGFDRLCVLPRVAAKARQPWALGRNRFAVKRLNQRFLQLVVSVIKDLSEREASSPDVQAILSHGNDKLKSLSDIEVRVLTYFFEAESRLAQL